MGAPVLAFVLLRAITRVASIEAWLLSPLLLLSLLFFIGCIAADTPAGRFVLVVLGVGSGGAFVWLLVKVRQFPRVPDAHDVDRVEIDDPEKIPTAPPMLLRGELKCNANRWFRDADGRRIIPRGVNLAGGSKMPTQPLGYTHEPRSLDEPRGEVSFVNRPFPLDEADEHLARLRCWGYTFFRLIVTWEAVEHAGPGVYDRAYLDYLQAVVRKCAEHELCVFIDFHQDVWSRWTGGDGAPAWTLDKVGFNLDNLDASGAAVTKQSFKDRPYPRMLWNSNHQRLGAATMWTLFFAGNDFAPKTLIDGEPAQEYLQRHFCAAAGRVAQALRDEPNVIGFDVLNEPSNGFVGIEDATDISNNSFYMGWRVAPWDAMRLGAGASVRVDYFSSFLMYDGRRTLNPTKVCAWANGPASCVWLQNGVWKLQASGNGRETPELLVKDYFARNPSTGAEIDFTADYAIPFWKRAAKAIREHIPDAVIFAEPVLDLAKVGAKESPELSDSDVGAGYVWAKHWYDGTTLMSKHFSQYFGLDSVRMMPLIGLGFIQRGHGAGIATFAEESRVMGSSGSPVLVGEVGVPIDLSAGAAFDSEDFVEVTCAMNTSMRALEVGLASFTLWNYSPENSNAHGDNWNGEDLSIFSRDQCQDPSDIHSGGRCLPAVIRPYPFRVCGDPTSIKFDPYAADRRFDFVFRSDPALRVTETILFVPRYHYPRGANIVVSDGTYEMNWETQTLSWRHQRANAPHTHWIVIRKPIDPAPSVPDSEADDTKSLKAHQSGPASRRVEPGDDDSNADFEDVDLDDAAAASSSSSLEDLEAQSSFQKK
ncbi:Endoglycoceramidase [Hondaea fermentalgiana]|uniref:Endoglycoceramidase n=1 Tax=Hondaea fermentalgiana TaxID=2315210 RepID=A0A2R5G3K6_9STRA|nr:Endoglycoceramidase [Hondaea fermentalgiana]|eukprot:GBG25115.1 Endoglycoceramidase [Hondaea fermentalgiana]